MEWVFVLFLLRKSAWGWICLSAGHPLKGTTPPSSRPAQRALIWLLQTCAAGIHLAHPSAVVRANPAYPESQRGGGTHGFARWAAGPPSCRPPCPPPSSGARGGVTRREKRELFYRRFEDECRQVGSWYFAAQKQPGAQVGGILTLCVSVLPREIGATIASISLPSVLRSRQSQRERCLDKARALFIISRQCAITKYYCQPYNSKNIQFFLLSLIISLVSTHLNSSEEIPLEPVLLEHLRVQNELPVVFL